jgi:hypothetical protein
MMPRRTHPLVKLAIGLLLLGGIALLFWRSLGQSRAEPYTVRPDQLTGWKLVTGAAADPEGPLVMLQPPPELPLRLFRQVFARAGESLSTPLAPGIALVLGAELGTEAPSADELLELARASGLDGLTLDPRCMAYRRDSRPGSTRQLYFVLFDTPEFARFRQALADRVNVSNVTHFDPAALSPVMPLAAQPDFSRWMPIVADAQKDCVAPVQEEQ